MKIKVKLSVKPEEEGFPKVTWFILWGTVISMQQFIDIHPVVSEILFNKLFDLL